MKMPSLYPSIISQINNKPIELVIRDQYYDGGKYYPGFENYTRNSETDKYVTRTSRTYSSKSTSEYNEFSNGVIFHNYIPILFLLFNNPLVAQNLFIDIMNYTK
jgi:hypothetical protein